MALEVTGKLHKVFQTENKSGSFQAREFVIIIENGNYPQYVKFQLVQDRCALIDAFREGQDIKVHFDLRGREWNGKYLTNLNAWRLEPVGAATDSVPSAAMDENFFPSADDEPGVTADDDLPF